MGEYALLSAEFGYVVEVDERRSDIWCAICGSAISKAKISQLFPFFR